MPAFSHSVWARHWGGVEVGNRGVSVNHPAEPTKLDRGTLGMGLHRTEGSMHGYSRLQRFQGRGRQDRDVGRDER